MDNLLCLLNYNHLLNWEDQSYQTQRLTVLSERLVGQCYTE